MGTNPPGTTGASYVPWHWGSQGPVTWSWTLLIRDPKIAFSSSGNTTFWRENGQLSSKNVTIKHRKRQQDKWFPFRAVRGGGWGGGCASFPRMWAGTLSPGISIYSGLCVRPGPVLTRFTWKKIGVDAKATAKCGQIQLPKCWCREAGRRAPTANFQCMLGCIEGEIGIVYMTKLGGNRGCPL